MRGHHPVLLRPPLMGTCNHESCGWPLASPAVWQVLFASSSPWSCFVTGERHHAGRNTWNHHAGCSASISNHTLAVPKPRHQNGKALQQAHPARPRGHDTPLPPPHPPIGKGGSHQPHHRQHPAVSFWRLVAPCIPTLALALPCSKPHERSLRAAASRRKLPSQERPAWQALVCAYEGAGVRAVTGGGALGICTSRQPPD